MLCLFLSSVTRYDRTVSPLAVVISQRIISELLSPALKFSHNGFVHHILVQLHLSPWWPRFLFKLLAYPTMIEPVSFSVDPSSPSTSSSVPSLYTPLEK
jgi:hypothetical protein